MSISREFRGIWIPRDVWLDKRLSIIDKGLLAEIESFCRSGECFASNEYFSEFFGVSQSTISRSIKKLRELGFIEYTVNRTKNGSKRSISALVKMTRGKPKPTSQNDETPTSQNDEYNNTSKDVNNTGYKPPLYPLKGDKPKKGSLDYSFIKDDNWKTLWKEWCTNKRNPFKKQKGMVTGFTRLQNISNKNLETAKEIVIFSISNNYAGLFPLKNSPGNRKEPGVPKDYNNLEGFNIIGGKSE